MMLENIDHYAAQIAVLDERIAVLCEPYERQIAQLDAIPGFGVVSAQELIAGDRHRHDRVPDRGAPVLLGPGRAPRPGVGGKRKGEDRYRPRQPLHRRHARRDRRRPPAGPRPPWAPSSAASAKRMPKKKALGAIMRRPARHRPRPAVRPRRRVPRPRPRLLPSREPDTRRQARNHLRGLERLGYKVTIEKTAPEPGPEPGELITRTAS